MNIKAFNHSIDEFDQAKDKFKDKTLFDILKTHKGHNIAISSYSNDCVCLECNDCNQILVDAGIYTITARNDLA